MNDDYFGFRPLVIPCGAFDPITMSTGYRAHQIDSFGWVKSTTSQLGKRPEVQAPATAEEAESCIGTATSFISHFAVVPSWRHTSSGDRETGERDGGPARSPIVNTATGYIALSFEPLNRFLVVMTGSAEGR